ncbi:MAG: beta-ketoacyl synthase N-terminal-like domain-containing protein [Planctomycetota bacterium]|jgi:3-oxoacyl-(acyl-carrier-protein) synthase
MTQLKYEGIVLTGCGWVTPFAAGTIHEVLDAAGRLGQTVAHENTYWAVPDELRDDYANLTPELKGDRGAWIAALALENARTNASLGGDSPDPARIGMVLGCALAGQSGMMDFATEVREQSPRFVSPIHFPQTVGNYIAGALARGYHIRGTHATIACGAASSLDAIVEAAGIVANGLADVVYAGGVNALSEELAGGLAEPGVNLSEGACLFVVERAGQACPRGANILATITRTSHHDITDQSVDGKVVVSGTLCREGGAIAIEHWIGQCLGAWGAACAAAAIGAAGGLAIPIRDEADPETITIARLAMNEVSTIDGAPVAMVFADADHGRRTAVELAVNAGG